MKYGLQLYTMRDITKADFEGALRNAAEIGYGMVETAGLFGNTPENVKAMADHYGLEICSTHTGPYDIFAHFEETIALHKKLGCKNIVIPGADYYNKEAVTFTVDSVNRYQPMIEAEGMKLFYHNHHKELIPNMDGQIALEEFASRTNIGFEIDVFWALNAGYDPVALLEKYKDRVGFVHLKDGIPSTDKSWSVVGKSTGKGNVPVVDVRKWAIDAGVPIIIESEGLIPSGTEEARSCFEFLKSLDEKDGI